MVASAMAKSNIEIHRNNVVNALSSMKVYTLATFPHFLHPNNALVLNENVDEDETYTPSLGIRATYPLQLATNINTKVEDNIVLRLVERKNQYLIDVDRLTGNYKRSLKGKKPKKCTNETYSMHLNNLMELTVKDPDPYFFGSYNWYYTGGVLETASIADIDFLFFATGEKLNIFNSATVESASNKDQLKIEHLDSTSQIACDTIYEIFTSNDNNFVAARQKNQFTVFHLQDEIDEKSKHNLKCERDIPFLSGTFINDHFFTIDAKRVIQRHDLAQNIECGRMYLKLPKNNTFWCQLKSYNNQLVFADESKLKIYDSRLFGRKASKCMELNIDGVIEKCDEITCFRCDADENNLYIGTTHNLFVFDVRYGMESTNQLTRYTHQLKTPPFMIDASGGGATGFAPNERLIALSGTFSDDLVVAQHAKIKNDKIRTNNLPRRIHSMSDTSRALRENGLRLEAESLLSKNRSISIGTCFLRKDSKLFLLSEKSSSEIFYQIVTEDDGQMEADIDDKPFRNMDLGQERDAYDAKIYATTITNFNSLKSILKYNLPNENEIPDTENPQPNKWQQSIEQLQSYKDMLSADLLSVWNEQISAPIAEKTDRSDFVTGWINTTSTPTPFDAISDNGSN